MKRMKLNLESLANMIHGSSHIAEGKLNNLQL